MTETAVRYLGAYYALELRVKMAIDLLDTSSAGVHVERLLVIKDLLERGLVRAQYHLEAPIEELIGGGGDAA